MKTQLQTTNNFQLKIFNCLLVIILSLTFSNGFSQTSDPLQYVYDHYGNKYSITSLVINTTSQTTTTSKHSVLIPCDSGIFQLYYEDGCGMENTADATHNARRAIVCQVFKDISDFINTPLKNNGVKVKIQIRDITATSIGTAASTSTVEGLGSSYYDIQDTTLSTATGGITDNMVYETIASGVDPLANFISNSAFSDGLYHGFLAINFSNPSFNFNTNLSNTTPVDKDLYSVVLHEVSHALGIQSLINYDGKTVFSNFTKNFYSRYDRFLKTYSNIPLISTTATGSATNSSMYGHAFTASTSTLYTNCTVSPPTSNGNSNSTDCTKYIKYLGNASPTAIPLYTPTCFETGSSLSHFSDQCYGYANNAYFVMSNAINSGTVKRYYTPEERNVLCDIGYSVNTTFGTHVYAGASVCGGNRVVGIDDGIVGGQYTNVVTSGITSSAISFLNNDVSYDATFTNNNQADLAFEGLQDITATSTITMTGNTFTFASTVIGFHVLRYVPYSISTGQRGNITYIYIYVRSDANCNVSPCNYVNNSGFESAATCGQILSTNVSCWYSYCEGSSCVFTRNTCTIPYLTTGLSTNVNTTAVETHNASNNNFVMLNYRSNSGMYDILCSRLSIPIVPVNTYKISYWARVGNKFGGSLITNTSLPINISLLPNTASTAPLPNTQGTVLCSQGFNIYYPASYALSHSDVPNDNGWHFYSQTFSVPSTATVNLETIAVYSGNGVGNNSEIFLDDVSIRPVGQEGTFALPPSICSNATLSNLTAYLSNVPLPANGVFEGPGVSLNSGVYSFNPAALAIGSYTVTYTYTNAMGCIITISGTITVTNTTLVTPTFTFPLTLCTGDTAPVLPTTSSNGITGSWNPATVSNITTANYIFTPTVGLCANAVTKKITVVAYPVITSITPNTQTVCLNATPIGFQVVATGTSLSYQWYSNTTNTTSGGTLISGATAAAYVPPTTATATKYYYVTIKSSSVCTITSSVLTVIVTSGTANAGTLSGTQSVCKNSSTVFNATVSGGTWSSSNTAIASISSSSGTSITITGVAAGTATINYTVTGTSGCINSAPRTVTVTNPTVPSFFGLSDLLSNGPICQGASPAPILPTTSDNSIPGTWNPTTMSTAASGNYLFTPALGQCASSTNLGVTVLLNNAFVANADTFVVTSGATSVVTGSILTNDTYNGGPIPSMFPVGMTWSVVPVGTSPTSYITYNNNGTYTVAPNTPSGTYVFQYNITTECFVGPTTTVTILVNPFINSVPPRLGFDFCYKNNGTTGSTSSTNGITSLYNGVTINGQAVVPGTATITTTPIVPSVLPITINNYDGTFTVNAGLLPQIINFTYTITVGGVTSASITCTINIRSTLKANSDTVTFSSNGSGTYNVLSNDYYYGDCSTSASSQGVATTSTVTVTQVAPFSNAYSIGNNGLIIGNFPISPGTYVLSYKICDNVYSGICQTATVTITVPSTFAPTTNPNTSISKTIQVSNSNKNVVSKTANDTINIPDPNFKAILLAANTTNNIAAIGAIGNFTTVKIDTNNDGEIQVSEAQAINYLLVINSQISDLTGIEYFTNLKYLYCAQNNLTSIDLSQLIQLERLGCYQNNMTLLNLSTLLHLQYLFCYQNNISLLDFSHNPQLTTMYCGNNQIGSLDFSANPLFNDLGCRNNQLTSLNIKNGTTQLFGSQTFLNECWTGNPNLVTICADAAEIPALQSFMSTCGVNTSGMVINSSCSMGVESHALLDDVTIAPNPSSGVFEVEFTHGIAEKTSIMIYNVLGQEVKSLDCARDDKTVKLDLSDYPSGVYLVKITSDTGVLEQRVLKK